MNANREKNIQLYYSTLHQTLPYFDSSDAVLNKSYAPGKWTMRELLLHLSDCEAVYTERLRRMAAEEKPYLVGFDETRWSKVLFYGTRDLNLARAQFEVARRSNIELLRNLDDSFDTRAGTHSEAGPKTFTQIMETIGNHNAHHLEQIRAIAEGRTWTKK